MTEVDDFAQSDLDEEDVMLLDTWEEVRGQRRSKPKMLLVFICERLCGRVSIR